MEYENLFTVNRDEEGADRAKPFLVREVPAEIAGKQDDLFQRMNEQQKAEEKAIRRRPYTGRNLLALLGKLLGYVAAIAGLVIVWVFLPRSEEGATFAEMFAARPALFIAGCVLLVAGFVLMIVFARRRPEPVVKSPESLALEKEAAELETECFRVLGVPEGATHTDLLMRFVKNDRNGNEKNDGVISYFNRDARLFTENGRLCIGYADAVYAIPLGAIRAIRKCAEKIAFFGWNKGAQETAAIRERYAVTAGTWNLTFREYCVVLFRAEGRDLGLVAPPYELDVLAALLPGVPVEEA